MLINQKGNLHLVALVLVLVLILVGGAYYLGTKKDVTVTLNDRVEASPSPEQSPTAKPTVTTTPSPTPTTTMTPTPQLNNGADSDKPTFIKVVSPNGGESFKVGDTIHITWESNNLNKSGSCIVKLAYEGGKYSSAWVPVNTPKGFVDWKVTDESQTQAKVDMECYDSTSNLVKDQSDGYFSITN